jgi:ABC-type glycerol-3-phosphate transport system substrate-binding protein
MHFRKWSGLFISILVVTSLLVSTIGFVFSRVRAQEKTLLTLGSWDDENGNQRHLAAIADFEAQYPDIDV